MEHAAVQQLDVPPLLFCRWSCEFGSGRFSLGTRCMTQVLPAGSPSAPSVTLPCRNRPWYISRRISALLTLSSLHSCGQLSKTNCAMSPALSLGLNRNSFVLPETSIRRRLILSCGMFLDPMMTGWEGRLLRPNPEVGCCLHYLHRLYHT